MEQTKSFFSTKKLVLIALITAITCILAPISIALPISPVPISLTTLVLLLGVYVLGWKGSVISCCIYLLLGLVGLPVFSGFSGGFGKLAGPTGGYLIGYLFICIIAGYAVEKKLNLVLIFISMVISTAILYTFGTLWLSHQLGITFLAGLPIGVLPYIPLDIIKIVIAMIIGPVIQKRLSHIQ
ncbi:biotin transport system substrate-specific component [Aequitasia blattaphilus]|uniref:Biotin transporter n=1 Tax=Aequitasia blattaphilus TaxID=2949332 RepID=A0ABT1E9W2_9FIRM|nr:biotin transporter BioY [Aequitasia blattaphilus]MCP1102476.1 biotin transporter BioY [Aequitasia blattaphilus]MCR8615116.1 biotin transporter BioY [Aequitasia blattaphilus]